jgi:hypothetical protein
MTTSCAFCRRDREFSARSFCETDRWSGFLAAPANIRGHAILAVKSTGAREKGEGYETGRCFEFLGEQEKAVDLGLRIMVLDTDVERLRQLSRRVPHITTSPVLPDE